MPTNEEIIQKCREYLFFQKKTLQDFSKEIGYSRNPISGYFSGKKPITSKLAFVIYLYLKDKGYFK